ncbi:hypothetical protein U1Q18_011692 [Sarracenia purpurea var. burkii]
MYHRHSGPKAWHLLPNPNQDNLRPSLRSAKSKGEPALVKEPRGREGDFREGLLAFPVLGVDIEGEGAPIVVPRLCDRAKAAIEAATQLGKVHALLGPVFERAMGRIVRGQLLELEAHTIEND